jgi:hypothetical protein
MGEQIRVIGRYVPSRLQSEIIETEIKPYLPSCCQCERISVRTPMGIQPMYDNMQWHQDGGGAAGTTKHMVVWASEQPTELRTSDGVEVEVQPFDLVWFDNTKVQHRQPRGTNETARWFVSVRCSGEMF